MAPEHSQSHQDEDAAQRDREQEKMAAKKITNHEEQIARSRVMSAQEAAKFVGVSLVHFRRIYSSGQGPTIIRLTERRIGFRVGDIVDWIEKRVAA
jgi:predicted DNA-binding transcriptional regulator AlpA